MSVLHRIDEIEDLPGPRFFAYCYRLTVYGGAVANLQARQAQRGHARSAPTQMVSLDQWAAAHPQEMFEAAETWTGTR